MTLTHHQECCVYSSRNAVFKALPGTAPYIIDVSGASLNTVHAALKDLIARGLVYSDSKHTNKFPTGTKFYAVPGAVLPYPHIKRNRSKAVDQAGEKRNRLKPPPPKALIRDTSWLPLVTPPVTPPTTYTWTPRTIWIDCA